MKNNETTKKERIINGVLIAAGIGVTTCLGIEVIKHIKLMKEIRELNVLCGKALEQNDRIQNMYEELERIRQNTNTVREALEIVNDAMNE